jgi:pimeloyl-ACP methyl ester carboxylesterase
MSQGETSAVDVPETRYTRSGDVSIAYQVAGEGPFDVVLVPSLSHVELAWTRPDYQGQIPSRLASFARLIFFDRRGMGMSDRVVDESFETRMDDVRAVMDAAGSTRAALFGILDGGAMSALFAATHPERVSALVLLSSFPRVRWATDYPWGVPAEKWQVVKEQLMQSGWLVCGEARGRATPILPRRSTISVSRAQALGHSRLFSTRSARSIFARP